MFSVDCIFIPYFLVSLFLANQENNLLQVGSRKFFTHVSHQLHQPQYICSLNTASDLVSDPSSICSVFSEEFSKNFASPKLQSTHPEPHLEPTTSPSIACVNVDIVSVRLVLYQLRCSAAGPDGLPGIFFKTLAYWLAEPLCTVFQQSVHQGKIPDAWRQAKIIPLYKGKGSKTSPSSYRPISLTSIASKLLERIVASQLQDYLSANKLLCQQQHGFVHRRSTATNLLLCDSVIARHMNNKRPCDLFTLDFSRAFDKVSHSVLSTKLINLGIYGKLHKWIMDFLSHRSQFVSFNGAQSQFTPVTSGVVQGSAIGPQLFTIVINDLPDQVISADSWLFADDVKLVALADSNTACEQTQCDLDALEAWSVENELPLCIPKCQCLHLGKNNTHHVYTLCKSTLPSANQLSDLGIIRNADSSYSTHISAIVKRASRASAIMFKAFSTRNVKFQMKLYAAYIRPILEYASPVWCPSSIGLSQEIENVQRRHTRRLPGLRGIPYSDRLQQLHLDTLELRRRRFDLLIAFKALRGMLDIDSRLIGIELNSTAAMHTRGSGVDMTVHRASSSHTGSAFCFRIASLWNALPPNAKSAPTLSVFRRALQKHLKGHQ